MRPNLTFDYAEYGKKARATSNDLSCLFSAGHSAPIRIHASAAGISRRALNADVRPRQGRQDGKNTFLIYRQANVVSSNNNIINQPSHASHVSKYVITSNLVWAAAIPHLSRGYLGPCEHGFTTLDFHVLRARARLL